MIKPKIVSIDGVDYTIAEATCNQCNYVWLLRNTKPPSCPKCRSMHWDQINHPSYEFVIARVMSRISKLDSLDVEMTNGEIRNRDLHTCQACGHVDTHFRITYEETRTKTDLDVHHIDGNHDNNSNCNQILLCQECHGILKERLHYRNIRIQKGVENGTMTRDSFSPGF